MGRLRSPALLALLAVACIVLPAAAAGGPFSASSPVAVSANSVTFNDSTGEDPAAPDITTIVVSNNDAGIISFRIAVPNRPQLGRDMGVVIFINTDRSATTGDPDNLGADYVIQLLENEAILFKWDGTGFVARPGDPPQATLAFSWSSGAVITISAAELADTKQLSFSLIVLSGVAVDPVTGDLDFTNAKRDFAPGGFAGAYPFDVKVGRATLVVRKFSSVPAKPAAGKTFSLRLQAARSDTGALLQGGRVTCVGRAGGGALRGTGRFVGRQAVCSWRIPANAKGKTFRGSITIVFEGLKVTRSFSRAIG